MTVFNLELSNCFLHQLKEYLVLFYFPFEVNWWHQAVLSNWIRKLVKAKYLVEVSRETVKNYFFRAQNDGLKVYSLVSTCTFLESLHSILLLTVRSKSVWTFVIKLWQVKCWKKGEFSLFWGSFAVPHGVEKKVSI